LRFNDNFSGAINALNGVEKLNDSLRYLALPFGSKLAKLLILNFFVLFFKDNTTLSSTLFQSIAGEICYVLHLNLASGDEVIKR